MSRLISIIRKIIFSVFDAGVSFSKIYYSQEGEDIVLNSSMKKNDKGFYVDVGAHHPFRFSNTYFFYKKGWRGINIDATPGSMDLFKKYRSGDINLEVPISSGRKILDYYIFDEPGLNSFSAKLSKQRDGLGRYKIKKIIKLKTRKLDWVLDKYMPKKVKIDFMSVDVEGLEYEVLKSNNWVKYKPVYLLVEILGGNQENATTKKKIGRLLKDNGYKIIATTGRTVIFKRNE